MYISRRVIYCDVQGLNISRTNGGKLCAMKENSDKAIKAIHNANIFYNVDRYRRRNERITDKHGRGHRTRP